MRLWHEALIPLLPRQQLLGQHRECCALRGLGWGKPQSTVNYVFKHPYAWLVVYHKKVMNEMEERGYTVDFRWYDANYRGKLLAMTMCLKLQTAQVGYGQPCTKKTPLVCSTKQQSILSTMRSTSTSAWRILPEKESS